MPGLFSSNNNQMTQHTHSRTSQLWHLHLFYSAIIIFLSVLVRWVGDKEEDNHEWVYYNYFLT